MNSAVISIGNEILLGKTLNTNLAFLGAELARLGIPLGYSVTIRDDPQEIKQALEAIWGRYDVVISTGGLGPTVDDLSKAAIAGFFGKQQHFDEAVWQHVQRLFAVRGLDVPETNRCQAMVPDDFEVLKNERGTAPGLCYRQSGRFFFALQGVPLEMKNVFINQIAPMLQQSFPSALPVFQKTIHTHGISESRLAELIDVNKCLRGTPEELSLAWLPQTGRVDLRFYGTSVPQIEAACAIALETVAPYVWGYDEDSPASVLFSLLRCQAFSLGVAESCTGGLVQKLLTDVPGISECFSGGVIAYSNEIKHSLLQVKTRTLDIEGAVSAECALEMATGIKMLTKTSHSISVTGIAGPTGGSAEKPVGTIYFGFVASAKHWTIKQVFTGDRDSIRLKTAEFAILELIKSLQGRNT